MRKSDVFGRLGGEEFGVFLPDTTPAEAALVAERIRSAVSEAEFRPGGERRALSVSIGGVCFEGPINFGDLFRSADERLYAAKDTGRDRVELAYAVPTTLVAENRPTVH
ncbi:MAG: GGDEF domain-containing protein [Mesorhizobium sp.]|nr:GGDEF domain-containing protein [Mesorhizobium sp.]